MAQNKWELKHHDGEDGGVYHITNGKICLAVNYRDTPEETDEEGQAALKQVVDALNISNIDFHSENALELKQHIEIMQLQDQLRHEREKAQKLVDVLEHCIQFKNGRYKGVYLNKLLDECEQAWNEGKEGKV